jgi:alcohol dehydrogenase, propanol-preferring
MKAMILRELGLVTPNARPLHPVTLPDPIPGPGEILIQVSVCGVCHTELDEVEGRTPPPDLPVIPGHQVVGRVIQCGTGARRFRKDERVGVAWIFASCGRCPFCRSGQENLCPDFRATGRDASGGYAEMMVVSEDFAYPIPTTISDAGAAPLLCAGAIGYRSLSLAGMTPDKVLGLTGFGASAHLVLKLAKHLWPQTTVLVFARREKERTFARELGADWTGSTEDDPPVKPNCLIDTTPAWHPTVEGLRVLERGGRLVINAIRKEDADKDALRGIQYQVHLWQEKEIKSVANVTRRDVAEFLRLSAEIPIRPDVQLYPLADANIALQELKTGAIRGAKVLQVA